MQTPSPESPFDVRTDALGSLAVVLAMAVSLCGACVAIHETSHEAAAPDRTKAPE